MIFQCGMEIFKQKILREMHLVSYYFQEHLIHLNLTLKVKQTRIIFNLLWLIYYLLHLSILEDFLILISKKI